MCVRQYEYYSTLLHLLPFVYDFMIDFMRKKSFLYLSCPHRVNKSSAVLTSYVI